MASKNTASSEQYTVVVSGDGFEYVCQKHVLMDGSQMFQGMLEENSEWHFVVLKRGMGLIRYRSIFRGKGEPSDAPGIQVASLV